jgi:hypothetical protein
MSVISGNDGKLNAVYEVLYDGDDDAYVNVLLEIANK